MYLSLATHDKYSKYCRCALALIRGLGGLCPCPVCLIPKGVLSDLTTSYPDRTSAETEALVNATYNTKGEREKIIKQYGLRPITVSLYLSLKNMCLNLRCRMPFGGLQTPIYMKLYPLIDYMPTTWDYGELTFGESSKQF